MEARTGGERDVAGQPARHLPRRAPSGRSPLLQNTIATTALTRSNARTDAVRDTVAELVSMDEPRKRLAGMFSGLDIHYDLGWFGPHHAA
jgi:hypothetical protein